MPFGPIASAAPALQGDPHRRHPNLCRAAVDEARFVAEMLSTAPHLKPTREFTERIMGGVIGKNDPDRIELMKFCRWDHKHTLHRETK